MSLSRPIWKNSKTLGNSIIRITQTHENEVDTVGMHRSKVFADTCVGPLYSPLRVRQDVASYLLGDPFAVNNASNRHIMQRLSRRHCCRPFCRSVWMHYLRRKTYWYLRESLSDYQCCLYLRLRAGLWRPCIDKSTELHSAWYNIPQAVRTVNLFAI